MTSKLTRERLQEIINLACKTCSDGSVIYHKTHTTVDSKEIVELARMALSAIDGEQVAQCPYPCGWDTLNKLVIQDAAFVSLALVAGEPATESIRRVVISNNDRLLKVISFCRDVMPQAGNSPVIGIDPASGPDYSVEVRYVAPPGYVMVPKEPTEEMLAAAKEWTGLTSTAEVVYVKMLAVAPQEVKGE